MKTSPLLFSVIAIAFLGLGFFISKKIYSPPANSIVITNPSDRLLSTPQSLENAHKMTVAFRKEANLCGSSSTSSTSDSLKAGFFEITDSAIYDLASAINIIKNNVPSTTPTPTHFRVIYGLDERTTDLKLIVAGLDSLNKENTNLIYVIDNYVHCPVLCDINGSSIILGRAGDACR